MNSVQLNKIYMIMAKKYKCSQFEVFSKMNENGTAPIETAIEFQLPTPMEVDQKKLSSIVRKYISNVNFFYFVVEENSIILVLNFVRIKNMLGEEFEYSLN
jgi:NAD-specific glutamate dehydrogenase